MKALENRQRGIALVSVLFVVVLLASLIYHLLSRHAMTIASSQQTISSSQLHEMALGGEAFAKGVLLQDFQRDGETRADHLGEPWAVPVDLEENGVSVWVEIADLQGRFNLNALREETGSQRVGFVRAMCNQLGLNPNLANLWADWVDEDDLAGRHGAEDQEYLALQPPFRAANGPGAHISESFAMLLLEPRLLAEFARHAVPLPSSELFINANTASNEVLESLIPPDGTPLPINPAAMERKWKHVEEVTSALPMLDHVEELLAVASDYFEATVIVETASASLQLTSVLYREPETGAVFTQVRSFGRTGYTTFGTQSDNEGSRTY